MSSLTPIEPRQVRSYRGREQSGGVFDYVIDPIRYFNPNPSRVSFGLVGGNEVSVLKSNLVDQESDLKGLTHVDSRIPIGQHRPPAPSRPRVDLPEKDLFGFPFRGVRTTALHYRLCDPWRVPKKTPKQFRPHNIRAFPSESVPDWSMSSSLLRLDRTPVATHRYGPFRPINPWWSGGAPSYKPPCM